MFYTIELETKLNLKSAQFNKGVGFYRLKTIHFDMEELVYIDELSSHPFFISSWISVPQGIKDLFKEEPVEKVTQTNINSKGLVSEDFVLKMLAITSNREKFKNVKQ